GVAVIALAPAVAIGQASDPACYYLNKHAIKFPVYLPDPLRKDVNAVELHVSRDQGFTWQFAESIDATAQWITFTAEADGAFWFALRTIEKDGKRDPAVLDKHAIQLQVVFDTVAPKVELKPLAPRKDKIGVAWKVSDDYLDGASIKLEYRMQDESTWTSLPLSFMNRECYWTAPAGVVVVVRLTARDRAGNEGNVTLVIPAAANPK
ncbi:MAG: hypothetical protein HYR84_08975, partial [Planctomycetes bacterium]|nr:hypothetical protein [Planctomycetota bacterium]